MVSVLLSAVKRTPQNHATFFSHRHIPPKGFLLLSSFLACWIVLITCRFSLQRRRSASVMHVPEPSSFISWWPSSSCTSSSSDAVTSPVIDIIAVGSLLRQQYLQAQLETFGTHRFVRDVYPLSELNDTDATCATELTAEQRRQVMDFCTHGDRRTQSFEEFYFRTDLFGPTSDKTGWLCAQKRPVDGLHLALQRYQAGRPLPDYLFIIDDDTYLHLDALEETLRNHYPPDQPHVVAGCTYRRPGIVDFVFPVGGVGSLLTRAAVEQLRRPLDCAAAANEPFVRWACWRLAQDPVGERAFFTNGMSIGDLMYAYAAGLPYTGVDRWNRTGYCFHSDHTLGYFWNYYHVAVPESILAARRPSDTIRKEYGVQTIAGSRERDHSGRGGDCDNLWEKCTRKSRICHYTNPEQMRRLYRRQSKC